MKPGTVTSEVEILSLRPEGLTLQVVDKVYFLGQKDYPWFQKAPVGAIWNVVRGPGGNLHWPELDVDLELASLEDPASYPLTHR